MGGRARSSHTYTYYLAREPNHPPPHTPTTAKQHFDELVTQRSNPAFPLSDLRFSSTTPLRIPQSVKT